jgi:hypothetical protein
MKKNNSVLIRKLAATEAPMARTPSDDAYTPGTINPGLSLPVAYEIEGELLRDVVIGEVMTAFRRKRNGVETPGIFESTPVVSIERGEDQSIVRTANSVYVVIPLSPDAGESRFNIQ